MARKLQDFFDDPEKDSDCEHDEDVLYIKEHKPEIFADDEDLVEVEDDEEDSDE